MIPDIYSQFDCNKAEASYYFFHIPKTAGTSLSAILNNVFSPEEVCPAHLWHELIKYPGDELSRYRLFRGHFYASLGRVLDKPLKGFVFFRNPLERALSHYGHVIKHSQHYLHDRANELGTLEAYLRDPVTRETVRNFQAKCLVSNVDPVKIAASLSNQELAEFGLEKIIETTVIDLSEAELLEQAKSALEKFCCIGITERFEDSIWLLSNTFGWDLKQSVEALNINKERPKASNISKEAQTLLEELNSVDMQLYQYAFSLFEMEIEKRRNSISAPPPRFVSYAQNFEDVMLWRGLKHIENGFYIDIGAQDPVVDSVSLAFYEHGWRGVHVEPTQQYSTKLREARPDEIVEQVAVGSTEGLLIFYEFNDTGLSTADPEIARRHQSNGYRAVATEVAVVSLDVLFDRYNHKPVHWLKLDVEGLEKSVLEGWRISTCRPWILVIESTKPMTQEQSHTDWEPLVFDKGYSYAYFDGLNRFYVHHDHRELLESLSAPPNIFDGFVLSGSASHSFHQLVAAEAQQAEKNLQAIMASRSWRLTRPLRVLESFVQRIRVRMQFEQKQNYKHCVHAVIQNTSNSSKRIIKAKIRSFFTQARLFINNQPALKRSVIVVIKKFPKLEFRLRKFFSTPQIDSAYKPYIVKEADHLSPHALRIYSDLIVSIKNKKKRDH